MFCCIELTPYNGGRALAALRRQAKASHTMPAQLASGSLPMTAILSSASICVAPVTGISMLQMKT